jgi:rod shape-determining protein MreC
MAATLVFSFVASLLLLLDYAGYLAPVRNLTDQALTPIASKLSSLRHTSVNLWSGIADIAEVERLREENESLRQENSQLKEAAIAHEIALSENQYLRQQLGIEEEQPWHLLGAEVMIRSPDAGRRIITIGRGKQDHIDVGMAVIGQTGSEPAALVGIVEEVGQQSANILLMTDFGSRISARVLHNGTSTLGIVQGQWQQGSRLRLEQLERDFPLQTGAVVVSAGLTGELHLPLPLNSVPPNIPIGSVESITSDEHTSSADLRPYVDPDQVRYVWVILDNQ